MAQKLIRNIPDEVMAALEQKASAAGTNSEDYIRQMIIRDAGLPLVKVRYGIRFLSENGAAHGTIRRYEDHPNGVGGGCGSLSQEQFDAYNTAKELVRRNQPGDRERAFALLGKHFDIVNEIAV